MKQSRQIFHGFLAAGALLLLCIILRPAGLGANDGLSYFGIFRLTIIPYAAAFLIYEYCLWRAADALGHSRNVRLLALAMKSMAVLATGVLITPISWVENEHSLVAGCLFLLQVVVSLSFLRWGFHWIDAGLITAELLAGAAGLYYASGEHGLLLHTQIIFQVAFAMLLIRSLSLLSGVSILSVTRTQRDRIRAKRLLAHTARSSEDFFKIWPLDKEYFWSDNAEACVAYRVVGSVAFAIADPIAATAVEDQRVLQAFLQHCHTHHWQVCFVMVSEASREEYHRVGLKTLEIGASAVVDIQVFVSTTATNKWWRWQHNSGQKLGYQYEALAPPHTDAVLAELREVSDAWLKNRHRREQGFALGYFDEEYLRTCTVYVLRDQTGALVAFTNRVPVFNKLHEVTNDLMRFVPGVPHAMPYLLYNLLHTLAQEGSFEYFDLGFVPLAHMHGVFPSLTRMFGRRRFSAAGLEQFKDKFDPVWQPNYLAYNGAVADLASIALNLERAVEIERP